MRRVALTLHARAQRGFTLLEVLVALAILSMAIVVAIQGFASGLRLLKLSGEHQDAMLLADLKAREITTPTQAGRDSGTEGPFTWEREVKQVVTPDLDVEGRAVRWRQWEVDVHVRWGDHRQVSVATLRTVAGDGQNTITTNKNTTTTTPSGTPAATTPTATTPGATTPTGTPLTTRPR